MVVKECSVLNTHTFPALTLLFFVVLRMHWQLTPIAFHISRRATFDVKCSCFPPHSNVMWKACSQKFGFCKMVFEICYFFWCLASGLVIIYWITLLALLNCNYISFLFRGKLRESWYLCSSGLSFACLLDLLQILFKWLFSPAHTSWL